MCIYIYTYEDYVHIYIYMYVFHFFISDCMMYMYMYIYIYIYILTPSAIRPPGGLLMAFQSLWGGAILPRPRLLVPHRAS